MYQKKIPAETKLALVEQYKCGKASIVSLARAAGVTHQAFQVWLRNYDVFGPEVFFARHNLGYSAELKENAVRDYLDGKGSLSAICMKYRIRAQQ